MNCNIVINQQPSLPRSERSAPETKTKEQKGVEAARWGQENYKKKLKAKLLKDNQKSADGFKRIYRLFSARPE